MIDGQRRYSFIHPVTGIMTIGKEFKESGIIRSSAITGTPGNTNEYHPFIDLRTNVKQSPKCSVH